MTRFIKNIRPFIILISFAIFIITSIALIVDFFCTSKNIFLLEIYAGLFMLIVISGGIIGVTNSGGLKLITNILVGVIMLSILSIMIMSGIFIYKSLFNNIIEFILWIMSVILFIIAFIF